jgi:hypothetical protein
MAAGRKGEKDFLRQTTTAPHRLSPLEDREQEPGVRVHRISPPGIGKAGSLGARHRPLSSCQIAAIHTMGNPTYLLNFVPTFKFT